jgi:hypothetical protein
MADQLCLSLWYPNFRFAALPAALQAVMRQFAQVASGGSNTSDFNRVVAATAYPLDWTESPTFQRVYVNDPRAAEGPDAEASRIENAVPEATEQLHEDTAYEFEMRWGLWLPEGAHAATGSEGDDLDDAPDSDYEAAQLDPTWRLEPTRVRITGFGPDFDHGTYETNGHIRVDFGLDTPFTLDEEVLDDEEGLDRNATVRIQQNVEKLLAFTLLVEKKCGISSRLLWTESGEPLAEKLIARLQRLN